MISLVRLRDFAWEHGLAYDFIADPGKEQVLITFENLKSHCKWTYTLSFEEIDMPNCPITADHIINSIPKELYSEETVDKP